MLGLRALVIEEEYLVAADIEQTLRTSGVCDITVLRNIAEARAQSLSNYDLAIMEAKFGSPEAIDFAAALRSAGVAVIVTSADRAVQSLFPGATPLDKPFDSASLLVACGAARPDSAAAPQPAM